MTLDQRAQNIQFLEPSEIRGLIDAVPDVSKEPERDLLVIEVMWQAGARVTEARTLKPEHIGPSSLILKNEKQVKRTRQPDGTSVQVHDPNAVKEVQVSEQLCRHLKDFCHRNRITRGQYVFQGIRNPNMPLDRQYIARVMRMASEAAGVYRVGKNNPKTGRLFRGAAPHMLRHSNATWLYDRTGNIKLVQHQLGHSHIGSTTIYTAVKTRLVKRAVEDIDWYSKDDDPDTTKKRRKPSAAK